MKIRLFSTILALLILSTVYPPISFGQDSPQWQLPEGAKARIGKGRITEIAYSPDGERLAVAGSIGTCWLYDAQTGEELAPLTGHTGWIERDSGAGVYTPASFLALAPLG